MRSQASSRAPVGGRLRRIDMSTEQLKRRELVALAADAERRRLRVVDLLAALDEGEQAAGRRAQSRRPRGPSWFSDAVAPMLRTLSGMPSP